MKNIIKAQIYQLKREKLCYVVFAVIAIMQIVSLIVELGFSDTAVSAGAYLAVNGKDIVSTALMFAMVLTGQICGNDFMDKTGNYELMGGHLRKDIYFGRAVLSIVFGTAGTMLLGIAPVAVFSVINGWGDAVNMGDVAVCYLLSLFPILRVICEFVFISFVIKNAYIVMALGVIIGMGQTAWIELFGNGTLIFLGTGNLYKLFDFSSWSTFTLVGEKEIMIYDAALTAGEIIGTVASSVLIGGLFLLLGFLFFEKDDLN
ncbi:MAG: hypothetical protein NC300_01360 [Bacteroidales bacterium]|nr:hypothetical protein [Clostridium sp.]MCM1202773.1 hypothetical protein [Bacteroidales bacterium]